MNFDLNLTPDQNADALTGWLEAVKNGFIDKSQEIALRLDGQAARVRNAVARAMEVDAVAQPQEFSRLATEIQHELLWGIANLNMDSLTRSSGEIEVVAGQIRQHNANVATADVEELPDDLPYGS